MLRASLQSSGYAVVTASNGIEGLEKIESGRPDLIITDLAMLEMNGLELTQAVHRIGRTPILVLSMTTDERERNLSEEPVGELVQHTNGNHANEPRALLLKELSDERLSRE